ncbi:MAG: hypothetical protein E3J72_09060 [Planctomycetota bacterium]|nr:MAG: hypothetical protein E3J72_09060 [Planctomycetota bacterium]
MNRGYGNIFTSRGWPWLWKIFRAFRIPVYLHLFFIIFIASEILSVSLRAHTDRLKWTGFVTAEMFILFGIVLLHEFGHSLTARSQGGDADRIILWPLGGLALCSAPHTPKAQGLVAAGGPLVNVILMAVFMPLSWLVDGYVVWNPFEFPPLFSWFSLIAYLSYLLLLFNLIPAFPLDGGQIFRALLWPKTGFKKATMTVTTTGYLFAILLAVVGLSIPKEQNGPNFLLVAVGVFIGFACWQERKIMQYREDFEHAGYLGQVGGDFGYGETAKKAKPGFFERRRMKKEAERRERESRDAQQIRERVDQLLAKVSREGMSALTEEEKKFLKDASQKYKSS